jgi:hypothetical protein
MLIVPAIAYVDSAGSMTLPETTDVFGKTKFYFIARMPQIICSQLNHPIFWFDVGVALVGLIH